MYKLAGVLEENKENYAPPTKWEKLLASLKRDRKMYMDMPLLCR
jgi:hypothetical protein